MEPLFVNEYKITFEMYREWSKNPVGEFAVKSRKKGIRLRIILACCAIFIIIDAILLHNYYFMMFGFAFLIIAVNRLFIAPNKILKSQYNLILKSKNSNELVQKIIFSDNIIFEECNTTTRYDYSEIIKISEDDKYFYLFYNADMVLRILKSGFVVGTAEGFREFCDSTILSTHTA